ncbi:MAG: hypothetical protein AB8F95_14795 [Bacteroidia bacterium]
MSTPLISSFFNSTEQYLQMERFWALRFEALLLQTEKVGLWRYPWLNTRFANGLPFGDGDPIFSALSTSLKKSIKVVQNEDIDSFSSFTQPFTLETGEDVEMLIICCPQKDQAIEEGIEIIKGWMLG